MSFLRDLKVAIRSLARVPALWFTVAITLALGIGANAAIFSVVRGVLLKPLANRDEDRLLYVRQSAPGIGSDNTNFSVPEIKDMDSGLKSIKAFGTFSALEFTLVGLGDPRSIRAGVVDGNYFDVMGLRPVLGRLLNPGDDGPNAAGAVVLTYRFWVNSLHSDRGVIGKVVRLGSFEGTRSATIGSRRSSRRIRRSTSACGRCARSTWATPLRSCSAGARVRSAHRARRGRAARAVAPPGSAMTRNSRHNQRCASRIDSSLTRTARSI